MIVSSVSVDATCRIWSVETAECFAVIKSNDPLVYVHLSNNRLALGSLKQVDVYCLKTYI